jgi:hypothetical protein
MFNVRVLPARHLLGGVGALTAKKCAVGISFAVRIIARVDFFLLSAKMFTRWKKKEFYC